MPVPLKPS